MRVTWVYRYGATAGELGISDILDNVTIPYGTVRIGRNAFAGAGLLTAAIVPSTVTSIANYAFPVDTHVIWEGRQEFRGHTFLRHLGSQTRFSVPVVIGGRIINTIAPGAFLGSPSQEVVLQLAVTSVGAGAFNPETRVEWATNFAFRGNTFLEHLGSDANFGVPSMIAGRVITHIADNAFGWNTLSTLTIPSTVTNMGRFCSFDNPRREDFRVIWDYNPNMVGRENIWGYLEEVNVPSSVTVLGAGALEGASRLRFVNLHNGVVRIGEGALRGTAVESVLVPSSVTAIGAGAFEGVSSLRSVSLGANSNLQTIGDRAFSGTGIERIAIPNSVTIIGERAFENTASLTGVDITANSRLHTIGAGAFGNTGLSRINLPGSVSYIGAGAFGDWNSGRAIEVGGRLYAPSAWAAGWSGNAGVDFAMTPGLSFVRNYNMFTYSVSRGTAEAVDGRIYIPAYRSGRAVTRIANSGFAGMSELREIVWLGDNITSIGGNALRGTDLESIEIPSGVTSIERDAFLNATSLREVVFLGDNVTRIGDNAFGNTAIESIEIPSGVTFVGRYAFLNATSLREVTITGDSLVTIGDRAFANTALLSITVPASVTNMGSRAMDATNLVIYAGAYRQPDTWHSNWNPNNRNVVWASNPNEEWVTVTTATQLANLANSSRNYRLGNDITLTGNWTPIPNFSGRLDGMGHTIRGLNISRGGQYLGAGQYIYLGLMGRITGIVQNLNIYGARIVVGSNHAGTGWLRAGVVAGGLACRYGDGEHGRIDNVTVTNATMIVDRCLSQVGGLVGFGRGYVSNSSVIDSELRGNGDMGGLVAFVYGQGTVRDSAVSNLTIWHWSVHASRSVGGVVGFQRRGGIHGNTVANLSVTTNGPNPPPIIGGILGVHDLRHPTPRGGYAMDNSLTGVMLQGQPLVSQIGGRLTHSGVA